MQTFTKIEPEHIVTTYDHFGSPHEMTFPETEHTYAPTLATIHEWLFGDWGPFTISWYNGALCPFHSDVGTKNITCSNGLRKQCYGLLIDTSHVSHLSPLYQKKLNDRVMCYEWSHRLSLAYWNIPIDDLLALPDNPPLVAHHILKRVFKETDWYTWLQEKDARNNKKRKADWIKTPIPQKPQL